MTRSLKTLRKDALSVLGRALAAVHGGMAVAGSFGYQFGGPDLLAGHPLPERGRTHLLAVGKAAVPMAEAMWRSFPISSGLIVTSQPRWGRTGRNGRLRVIMASHPLPNEESLEAGREALALVDRLHTGDCLVALVSGGASALMEDSPVPLEDLRTCYANLLRSGMDIRGQNEVRKGLSNVKGGRLAERVATRGAHLVSLIVSDIVGDPIADIGSGPTAPHSSRGGMARATLQNAGLWETMPASVRTMLDRAHTEGREWHDATGRIHAFVAANNEEACRAATRQAEALGYHARILTTSLQGEARRAGREFTMRALSLNAPFERAAIAGGETTVTVRGQGRGGRNQEFALSAVDVLDGRPAVLVACGTDGVDGNTEAAGAIVDGTTRDRARKQGLDPQEFLERNDSHAFFRKLDDCLITGPTGTNVSDLVILLEDRSGGS